MIQLVGETLSEVKYLCDMKCSLEDFEFYVKTFILKEDDGKSRTVNPCRMRHTPRPTTNDSKVTNVR